jgi:hypothetical protein
VYSAARFSVGASNTPNAAIEPTCGCARVAPNIVPTTLREQDVMARLTAAAH